MTQADDHPRTLDGQIDCLYSDLRQIVARQMRRGERPNHTLEPTAVVHEAYLRLREISRSWSDENTVRGEAVRMVYRVLIDHARRRDSQRRGGGGRRLSLTGADLLVHGPIVDILDLDDALLALGERRPRQRDVAVLRFIGGMTLPEVGRALGISPNTAKEHWAFARAFLLHRLGGSTASPHAHEP